MEEDKENIFNDYIVDVKSQLTCNTSKDVLFEHITYNYEESEIDNHLDYFTDCMDEGLSPYIALLFFYDYLELNKLIK